MRKKQQNSELTSKQTLRLKRTELMSVVHDIMQYSLLANHWETDRGKRDIERERERGRERGEGKCTLFSIPFDSSHVFSPLPAIFSIYFFIEVTSLFLFLFSFDSSKFSFLFSLSLPLSLTIRPNLNCLEFSAKPVSSVFPSHSCNLIALFG